MGNFHVPKPIKTFYDQILSNPGSQEYGQNMTLINQTLAEDWNIRPNPFSQEQSIQAGPFPRGLKQMTGMWHQMMPDIEVERLQTIRMGNKVAVISEVSATMRDLPQGFDEYPMFPGIPVEKLKGKNFTTLCLAVHVLDDKEHHHDQYEHQHERIRRSWAIEDWTEAADQMLHNRRPAKLDHPWHKRGQNLTTVPYAIHRFYDQILSNPTKAAQNFTLLNETVREDWTVRPNPADIVGGKGPGDVGLQRIMQLFGEIIPDLKFEKKCLSMKTRLLSCSRFLEPLKRLLRAKTLFHFSPELNHLKLSARTSKPLPWISTALLMARSNNLTILKTGEQLYIK